jgi:hypothetical protein
MRLKRMKGKRGRRAALTLVLAALVIIACGSEAERRPVTPEDARAIAEEAYIYAFPVLRNYQALRAAMSDRSEAAAGAPFNAFRHESRLPDAASADAVTPNLDTLHSSAWLDLRAEPMVISVPEMPDRRYFHLQLVDMYTHNFAFIGSRATGTNGGHYLIAGPGWEGPTPGGITKVVRSEGEFVFVAGRTRVDGPDDVTAAAARQREYRLRPLSIFLGGLTAPPAAPLDFPVWEEERASGAGFIEYFNFLLSLMAPPPPGERAMFDRFTDIGIGPGRPFDLEGLDAAIAEAIDAGVAEALVAIRRGAGAIGVPHRGWRLLYDACGDRDRMAGRFTVRASAAYSGLHGNSIEEAFYPLAFLDGGREGLDGRGKRYRLTFARNDLPPVEGFWSITIYRLPDRKLVENRLERYAIRGDDEGLRYGGEGDLTLDIQSESPGAGREGNWLPAPQGPFYLVMRLYWPGQRVIDGSWKPPPVVKLERP